MSWRSLPRLVLEDVVDLLWRPRCLLCDREPSSTRPPPPVCDVCDEGLPWLGAGGCPICQAEGRAERCRACRSQPPGLVRCRAALELDPLVRDWVHRWKYPAIGLAGLDGRPLRLVRHWLTEGLRGQRPPPGTVVTCVPLHPRRLRQRGFQPSALLARVLARQHGLAFAPHALLRQRDDPSQTGLSRPARRRNVAGTFRARPGLRLPPSVWLVDDVVTTGATIAEVTRVLTREGAREVSAFCLARTPEASDS